MGVHKKLEGHTAGTADPHWPQENSIPYVIVLNNKTGRSWPRDVTLVLEDSVGIDQQIVSNCIVHLLLWILYYYFYLFLFCPFKLSLSQPTNFYLFSKSFAHPTGDWVSGWLCAVQLPARLKHKSTLPEKISFLAPSQVHLTSFIWFTIPYGRAWTTFFLKKVLQGFIEVSIAQSFLWI